MLSDNLFVQQSITDNLFFLRTLREFCLSIQLSFFENNSVYIDTARDLGNRYEELGSATIDLADGKLSQEILNSESFVTPYTLDAEVLTEKLFDVEINSDLTTRETQLTSNEGNNEATSETVNELYEINQDAISLTNNFIEFCTYIRDQIVAGNLFSSLYPSIFDYMIEEARLYVEDLERIQNRNSADPTFISSFEYYFTNSMKQASSFIMGLSDTSQSSIIMNANNYSRIFSDQAKRYLESNITPDTQKLLNEQSIEQVNNFIQFLNRIMEGILNQQLFFIIEPLFFDNLLTEAHFFLYLLQGAAYGNK